MGRKLTKMDIDRLKTDLRAVNIKRALNEQSLNGAIRLAGYELAHHLDLPELNQSGTITVTASTPNYAVSETHKLDRITSAVFQTSTKKSCLDEIDIRTYDHHYRGVGTEGMPYLFCYFEGEIWLYYIPDTSGTVYFRSQRVMEDVKNLKDNYYPLVYQLAKRNLFDDQPTEWAEHDKIVTRMVNSFKGRVKPYKSAFELSPHKRDRVKGLNERY